MIEVPLWVFLVLAGFAAPWVLFRVARFFYRLNRHVRWRLQRYARRRELRRFERRFRWELLDMVYPYRHAMHSMRRVWTREMDRVLEQVAAEDDDDETEA